MSRKRDVPASPALASLARVLDQYEGRYRELRGCSTFGEYVAASGSGADEETLTEPILASILEDVLDFGKGDYFPQLGKSGLKPDFTPTDLVTHRFVLDAKGSSESLTAHVTQIRRYVEQRALRFGVLFNGRQLRVYPSGAASYDKALSFELAPLWRAARGEQLTVGPDFDAFALFVEQFSHRTLSTADKIAHIRRQPSWSDRLAEAEVDVEFLVDQLRRLAGVLAADAAGRLGDLTAYVELSPDRVERVLDELRLLALDFEPGLDVATLPDTIAGWSSGAGTVERVWRQYLLRVAYLSVTRILLYRAWEDVGFVDEMLYDGGFDHAYERLDENVREVLRRAFLLGSGKYKTLFNAENNYEWYRPSDDVLVDVLYRLGAIPLGKLDQDALGALYVSYVDEIDRDRLGQFFTPRDVVRFMLDRVGFSGADVFRLEGDERLPLRVFDFATGSGGFLVEAARRIIDDSGIAVDDEKGLREALRAISSGFYGGEISPFPYYLTEINLLLQVSRLLGRMRVAGVEAPPFVLGVLRADSLETKSSRAASLDVEAGQRADRAELVPHDIYDVLPVEPEKHGKYRELRQDGTFDLVIGNPPYVAEANNRTLFAHFRSIDAWKGIYKGKTDYLYYFLLLAVEKLKPGGKLCVITPAGWMNAGAADFLRERLAAELTLEELFLFGSYRLFAADQGPAPTPTVESAILVATKAPAPKGHKLRVVVLEDESAVAAMTRAELLDEMVRRFSGRQGRRFGIHAHNVKQSALRSDYPWPVKSRAADVGSRVVAHLDAALADGETHVERLGNSWKPFMGIQTCADAFSTKIHRNLPSDVRSMLERDGAVVGDPVYALPPGSEGQQPWSQYPATLVQSPEPESILYGAIDADHYVNLVYLTSSGVPPDPVLDTVARWRPILERRAEITRNARRRWWETGWPRDQGDLKRAKVIALHRTSRGRFAVDEEGRWSPSGRMCVIVARSEGGPVAYLAGLLNSELLDLWYSIRGRVPRDIWRDYEPKPLSSVPYRQPARDPRADDVTDLVRAIGANRRALLPHRSVVRDLGRIVKDPWKTGPVVVDRAVLVGTLPARQTVSVRLDPLLTIEGTPVGKPTRVQPAALAFRRGGKETGRVTGEGRRLDLLQEIVGARQIDDLASTVLPKDMDAFERAAATAAATVQSLLDEGSDLVEHVERLVCALYGVPDELTVEVVARARRRAGSGTPAE